jgi:hypothetical protein
VETTRRSPPGTHWAYAYAIVPPQAEEQLGELRTILEREHAAALRTARTWSGRLVCEQRATHILVVSDTPDQGREVNRRLEARLRKAKAIFSLTVPMPLAATGAPPHPRSPRPRGP